VLRVGSETDDRWKRRGRGRPRLRGNGTASAVSTLAERGAPRLSGHARQPRRRTHSILAVLTRKPTPMSQLRVLGRVANDHATRLCNAELLRRARHVAMRVASAGAKRYPGDLQAARRLMQEATRRGLLTRGDAICAALSRALGTPPRVLMPEDRGTVAWHGEFVEDAGARTLAIMTLVEVHPRPQDAPHIVAWLAPEHRFQVFMDCSDHPQLTWPTLLALLSHVRAGQVIAPNWQWAALCMRAPRRAVGAPQKLSACAVADVPGPLCSALPPKLEIPCNTRPEASRWEPALWDALATVGDSAVMAEYKDFVGLGWALLSHAAPDPFRARRAWETVKRVNPECAREFAVWAPQRKRWLSGGARVRTDHPELPA